MFQNQMQNDVLRFHQFGQQAIERWPIVSVSDKVATLRKKLIREEHKELQEGLDQGNLMLIADGAVDLLYVVFGTMVSYGIDLQPVWDLVQRANMSKVDGSLGEVVFLPGGKITKPDEFVPPDAMIRAELRRQGADL